jgi:hypothetical protein
MPPPDASGVRKNLQQNYKSDSFEIVHRVRKRNSNDLGNTGHFSLSMSEHHFTN